MERLKSVRESFAKFATFQHYADLKRDWNRPQPNDPGFTLKCEKVKNMIRKRFPAVWHGFRS